MQKTFLLNLTKTTHEFAVFLGLTDLSGVLLIKQKKIPNIFFQYSKSLKYYSNLL